MTKIRFVIVHHESYLSSLDEDILEFVNDVDLAIWFVTACDAFRFVCRIQTSDLETYSVKKVLV